MTEQAIMQERTSNAGGQTAERTRTGRTYAPNVDIIEMSDRLAVLADMPGVDPGSIDINFENGTLTIHGRVPSREPHGARSLVGEYGVGDFLRTFQVSELIDPAGITAEYRDGVLRLELPKVEAARPRRIAVKLQEGQSPARAPQGGESRGRPESESPGRPGRKVAVGSGK